MKPITQRISQAALVASLLLSAPLVAAGYRTGVIDDVQEKERAIVVNDKWYRLSPTIKVHGPEGGLKKNMKIGFVTQNAGTRSVITEIWVLPDSFVLPEQ